MIELKEFSGKDFYEYQGVALFQSGDKPMIAKGEKATLIVSSYHGYNQGMKNGADICIFPKKFELGGILTSSKYYSDIERAKSDALLLAQMLDLDLSKDFLSDYGFVIIG